ncbi:hypothetical protein H6B11_15225 [Mediterraneibacter glycyrrhizinilyticus]|nr:hypothetical protein [Mediterraneibacter glycyrrhizinilyticus]MBM6855483.1 hypothetical protein [Mediterraneibacter glycyrrhizinilyticus]
MKREQSTLIEINNSGYHFESQREFKNSFYKNVYREAYLRVEDIINNITAKQGNENKRISAALQADFPNIITFIGSRGVGKTSAMLSFMEALKDYCADDDNNNPFYKFNVKGKILFTCLNCIDGSLMERGEDIFKTILAQMYQKFIDLEKDGAIHKGADFDFRKRELMRQLEDVYRTVCEIETMEKGRIIAGEAYISSLQSFSSSQKVRKDFVKLISNFTDLMRYNRFGGTVQSDNHYVVIAIDDIDLNIQNSFSMLEKIHRYCTVPNVIVLLTLDVQQILSIVTNHFYEVVPKVNKLLIAQEQYVHNLSMDYLEKVLPVNYRIYMPGVSKNVLIKKEQTNLKKAILGKLYRRTGICFDSQGLKQHFYVPTSMRELTGFYLMLESMGKVNELHLTDSFALGKKIENEEEIIKIKNIFEENYNIFLADLENRMILEKIHKSEDIIFFKNLMRADVHRAMTSVKEYYRNCVNRLKKQEIVSETVYMPSNADDTSYGELIEVLYALGRHQNGLYKPMVHCLIAYFSLAFTREYIYEKLSYSEDSTSDPKGMTESIIGGQVASEVWANSLIPPIQVMPEAGQGIFESNGTPERPLHKGIGHASAVRLDNVLVIPIEKEILDKVYEENEQYDDLVRALGEMEIMTLFFTNFVGTFENQRIWKFDFSRNKTGNYILCYDNTQEKDVGSASADFNVLNIITNSMYAEEKLADVDAALIEALETYVDENSTSEEKKTKDEIINKIKIALEQNSLKNEYKKWNQAYGGPTMPLPLWWFDFSYNILKRAFREQQKKNPKAINDTDKMYDYMKDLYSGIKKQLEQQQGFYNSDRYNEKAEKTGDEIQMVKLFTECPVIKMILDEKEKQEVDKEDEKDNEQRQRIEDMKSAVDQLFRRLKNFEGD